MGKGKEENAFRAEGITVKDHVQRQRDHGKDQAESLFGRSHRIGRGAAWG